MCLILAMPSRCAQALIGWVGQEFAGCLLYPRIRLHRLSFCTSRFRNPLRLNKTVQLCPGL